MKKPKHIFLLSLLNILFLCPLLNAQKAPEGLMMNLDSMPETSIESPSYFKTVIDTAKPENKLKSTEEVIGQTVGVDIDNFGGLGRLSTVSIRGSASNQVIILLDGTKLNSPSNQSVDLSSLPANLSGSIEILRGGTSAEYGDGAIGGVINVLPSFDIAKPESLFNLSIGSFETVKMDFFGKGKIKEHSYIFSTSFFKTQGNFKFTNINNTPNNPDDDFTNRRNNNFSTQVGTFAKLKLEGKNSSKINLAAETYFSKKGIPGTVYFPSDESTQRDFRNVFTLEYIKPEFSSISDMRISLTNMIDTLKFIDPQGELTGVPLKTDQITYNPSLDFTFDLYPWRSNLLTVKAGSSFHSLHQITDGTAEQKPFRVNPYLAVKDQISLLKNRLILSPIIRMDSIYDSNDAQSKSDMQFNPKLGVLWVTGSNTEIKTNIGTSFRYPNFSELYFNQGFVEGNTDLSPEKALNFDIGIKVSGKNLMLEFAYFLNRIRDIIVYEQISNFRYKPINIDEAFTQGLELTFSYLPFEFLKINLNSTFIDPKNKSNDPNKNGNLLPGRPRNRSNLRLTLFNPTHRLYSEFQFISSNYANEANTVQLDARYIVNCGYSYSLKKTADFSLEIKNILNDQIADIRGFPLPGTSFFASLTLKII